MYEDCKPKHNYWGLSINNLKGIITAINDDGSFEVDFHHPFDSYGVMGHSATIIDIENTDYWLPNTMIESSIKRFKKYAQVGDEVKINEYKNKFYITTYLEKPQYALAWVSRRGDPHLGHKTKYTIDVS